MENGVRVRFIDVGRDKKSWEADLPLTDNDELDPRDLERSIREQKAIMSDLDFDEENNIRAGDRIVGRFEVVGVIE